MAIPSPLWLLLLDHIISGLLFGPLTVFYWRGTWTLLNLGFASNPELGFWVSVLIGNVGMCTVVFLQHVFMKKFRKDNMMSWLLGYHLHIYVFAFFNVNQWRGIWGCLNVYTGTGTISHICSAAIGFVVLLLLRCTKNCQAPPVTVVMDNQDEQSFFSCPARFKIEYNQPGTCESYILDNLFTCLVVYNCVVLYWRGVWGLLDNFLYPDNIEHSTFASIGIGYGLLVLLLPWQLICDKIYQASCSKDIPNIYGWLGKAFADILLFLPANFCSVCNWRGIWMACDLYIWPEKPGQSSWITHGVGMAGLMFLVCAKSVILCGCELDGDGDGRGNCLLANRYLRYWLIDSKDASSTQELPDHGPDKNVKQEQRPESGFD